MNKTIYKYPLILIDSQAVSLPIGSEILTIQTQEEMIYMWVLINPNENQNEIKHIEFFGTGYPISYDMGVSRKYISTFQMYDELVFHAFEYTGV